MMPRAIRARHSASKPAAPKSRKGPVPVPERAVQRAAIRLIEMAGYRAIHVANGVKLSGDKLARIKQMAVLKADGFRPGFPDLIIMGPSASIGFMEVKKLGGREHLLSDDQEQWRDWMQANGWNWWFLNKPEDVFVAFRAWGWKR